MVRAYDLDVPVVIMTGKPSLETAIEAVELGALQYLVKPVPTDVLERTLVRAGKLHRIARLKREALKFHGEAERQAGDRAGLSDGFRARLQSLRLAFQPIVNPRSQQVLGTRGFRAQQRAGAGNAEHLVRGRTAAGRAAQAGAADPRQGVRDLRRHSATTT